MKKNKQKKFLVEFFNFKGKRIAQKTIKAECEDHVVYDIHNNFSHPKKDYFRSYSITELPERRR